MKSSDCFRALTGDRLLMVNAAARAVYECLRRYEIHHAEKHRDCEEAELARLEMAIAAAARDPDVAHLMLTASVAELGR